MTSCSTVAPLVANIYYRGPHLESALTPSLRRRLCETSASLLMPISACARTFNGLSPAASLFCGNFVASDDQFHRLCFRRWSSPLCCPGWITVMLRWLAYRPTYLIYYWTLICAHRCCSVSCWTATIKTYHWHSCQFYWLRAPERIKFKLVVVYRGIHGTAPRYLSDLQHRVSDITSRRRLRLSTSSELVIPLSRLVTVGDRSFGAAGPRLWNTAWEHYTCAVFTGFPTKTEDSFVSAILSGHCIVACVACCDLWSLKLLLRPP